MTPEDIVECQHLGRQLADMELKLASWRRQKITLDTLIETMIHRMDILNQRKKALVEGKV